MSGIAAAVLIALCCHAVGEPVIGAYGPALKGVDWSSAEAVWKSAENGDFRRVEADGHALLLRTSMTQWCFPNHFPSESARWTWFEAADQTIAEGNMVISGDRLTVREADAFAVRELGRLEWPHRLEIHPMVGGQLVKCSAGEYSVEGFLNSVARAGMGRFSGQGEGWSLGFDGAEFKQRYVRYLGGLQTMTYFGGERMMRLRLASQAKVAAAITAQQYEAAYSSHQMRGTFLPEEGTELHRAVDEFRRDVISTIAEIEAAGERPGLVSFFRRADSTRVPQVALNGERGEIWFRFYRSEPGKFIIF